MKIKRAARVAASLNQEMHTSCEHITESQSGTPADESQQAAFNEMLLEETRARRAQRQPHSRFAAPGDGAGQQQIGNIGAYDEQEHSNEERQNPQPTGIPGIERTEATAARQDDQLWNLLRRNIHIARSQTLELKGDLYL